MDLPLRCKCGALSGSARGMTPKYNRRLVCQCQWCAGYMRHLGHPEWLDARDGSEIIAMYPAQMLLTRGLENLDCLQLKEKGLRRFFARCCNTPIANVASPKLPYLGVLRPFIEMTDETLGPVVARVNGPKQDQEHVGRSALYVVRFIAHGLLTGQRQPSPFFHPDGHPRVQPLIVKA